MLVANIVPLFCVIFFYILWLCYFSFKDSVTVRRLGEGRVDVDLKHKILTFPI